MGPAMGFVLMFWVMFIGFYMMNITAKPNEEALKNHYRRIQNVKNKQTLLFITWVINLIVFTAVLWAGEYSIHHGQEWMIKPVQITLFSTGAIKLILSTLLFSSIFKIPEEENNNAK